MVPLAYDPLLVLLSVVVAVQASFVSLRLTKRIADIDGTIRRPLVAGAALSLATGIWGMHFIGMLALKLPLPVQYELLPTLLSFLACVLVVGLALIWTSLTHLTWRTLAGASLLMGGGIVTMHYIGMTALYGAMAMDYDGRFAVAALAVSVGASALALWLAFGEATRPATFASAIVLGLAISGMHYTAMEGMTVYLRPMQPAVPEPAVSTGLLALIVSLVAFLVSGLFILTLIPERRVLPPAAASLPEASAPEPAPVAARAAAAIPPGPEPAGTPGAEARAEAEAEVGVSVEVGVGVGARADSVPVLRDGIVYQLETDSIVSIHADAHYTHVATETQSHFSPLSISEAERRLPGRFMRIHRSHIVDLERVADLKKTVDSAVVELRTPQRQRLPVARARLPELKRRLRAAREPAETGQ